MKIKHCLNDIPYVTFIIFKVLQALQHAKLYINQFLASVADIINCYHLHVCLRTKSDLQLVLLLLQTSPAFFPVLQLAPPGCVIYTNVEVSSAHVLKSNISAGKYSVTLV